MTDLIACLTNDKGEFEHVKRVIEGQDWKNIYVVTKEGDVSKLNKEVQIIKLDMSKTISELTSSIKEKLDGKINDLEVAVNIVAGTGKEHTAIISAVLKMGLGIRLVVLTPEGVRDI